MLIKVCGMRDTENIRAVSELDIDLMGFIFYPKSPRFVMMISSQAGIIPDYSEERLKKGRGEEDTAAIGLHVAYTEHGTPYYEEAKMVIGCETMTAWHQTEKDFRNDTPKEWYDGFEAGIHTVYIGEVIGAWRR